MRTLNTGADRRELIAYLRERDSAGEIGVREYFYDDGLPCCTIGHASHWLGVDFGAGGEEIILRWARNDDDARFNPLGMEDITWANDEK